MKIIKPAQLPERIPDKENEFKCPRCKGEFSLSYKELDDSIIDDYVECVFCGFTLIISDKLSVDLDRFASIERLYKDVERRKSENRE